MHATAGCYSGKLYYLASLMDDASTCTEGRCSDDKFFAPPNGNQNGGTAANPSNSRTLEDLYSQDITAPGFIGCPCVAPTSPSRPGPVRQAIHQRGQLPMHPAPGAQPLRRLDLSSTRPGT
ncbi:hypothetical protein KXX18_006673, partial [Aspergillus fumigatus]